MSTVNNPPAKSTLELYAANTGMDIVLSEKLILNLNVKLKL